MKQARPKATQPGLIWKWKPLPAQRSSTCCLLWCIRNSGVEWCLRVKQSTTQTVMDWCHNFICRTPHFVQSWSESYSFDVFTHSFFPVVSHFTMKKLSADKTECAVLLPLVEARIFANLSAKRGSKSCIRNLAAEKITGFGDVSAFVLFGLCSSLFCSNINHHL